MSTPLAPLPTLQPTARFFRLSAGAGIVGALLLGIPGLIEIVTGETTVTSLLIGVSAALLIPLVPALHAYQSRVTGVRADGAYLVNIVGLGLFGGAGFTLNIVLFFLDDPVLKELMTGPTRPMLLMSGLAFAAGTIAFGVTLIRSRAVPGPLAWGYTLLLPLPAALAPLPDSVLGGLAHGAAGAVLVGLALWIWSEAGGQN
jgi:hypothetical protein